MRLICPNCDAQYEVADNAIPLAGRDVQCSNCGHAWFQLPPEVEAERAAEAALFDAPEADPAPPPLPQSPAAPETVAGADPVAADRTVIAPIPAPPPLPPSAPAETPATNPAQRRIDDSVLAVLREEAEREMIARRLDAQALETQEELGIDSAVAALVNQDAAARDMARRKLDEQAPPAPAAPPGPPPVVAAPAPAPDPFDAADDDTPAPLHAPKRELTRRERLPDIEEINSTLRPGDIALDDDGQAYEIAQRPTGRSGFRSGFVLMLILALLVILVYVMAPRLSEMMPAAKPALDSYVATVDAARIWLDTATKGLVNTLRGLAGSEGPPP
ncbi:MAG: zinc-ribbon domain-containing protein [Rhodobacteraceae bacterium]|jgi:predicted Zn finger-like uncharacterized protein|nr:zinc-ribbon domain-containing protein [Paracoccaceae bacterium]